jgi:DNA gyrase subunit B
MAEPFKVKSKRLSEKDIERFAGLAGIRRKPIVYIGPTDGNGLWTIWREPGDNTADRALAGHNTVTHLIMDSEPNTYWVRDEGDGIPVGKKEFIDERGRKEQLSTFYVVTGLTHGGSNFSGKKISRGTHGLGIKTTNAMSTYFKCWTYRDGQWYSIEYQKGILVKDVHKSSAPKLPHGIKARSGTVICFKPDFDLFSKKASMPFDDARSWCELTSYMIPKLKVMFTNRKGKTTLYQTKRGPLDYLDKQKEVLKCEYDGKPFVLHTKLLDVVLGFSTATGIEHVKTFTNGLTNTEGGEHLRALRRAMYDSLIAFINNGKRKVKRPKSKKKKTKEKPPFAMDDVQDGLVGIVNAKLAAPAFNNQHKDKLIDERVYKDANDEIRTAFDKYWADNKALAKRIIDKAMELNKLTEGFQASKRMIADVRKKSKKKSAKLSGIIGNAPIEKREIFLCEGDSAAGGIKQARDDKFQAVFPLKGKPLNVLKAKPDKINANVEIVDVLAALEIDIGKQEVRSPYGKIIILADADEDGGHITSLLLGFFYKFTPQLIKKGYIYTVLTPRYRCVVKGNTYFGSSKEKLRTKFGDKADISYLKGLGELQPEHLYEVACNPETRNLVQIKYPEDKKSIKLFQNLIGSGDLTKQLLGINREKVNA